MHAGAAAADRRVESASRLRPRPRGAGAVDLAAGPARLPARDPLGCRAEPARPGRDPPAPSESEEEEAGSEEDPAGASPPWAEREGEVDGGLFGLNDCRRLPVREVRGDDQRASTRAIARYEET